MDTKIFGCCPKTFLVFPIIEDIVIVGTAEDSSIFVMWAAIVVCSQVPSLVPYTVIFSAFSLSWENNGKILLVKVVSVPVLSCLLLHGVLLNRLKAAEMRGR